MDQVVISCHSIILTNPKIKAFMAKPTSDVSFSHEVVVLVFEPGRLDQVRESPDFGKGTVPKRSIFMLVFEGFSELIHNHPCLVANVKLQCLTWFIQVGFPI